MKHVNHLSSHLVHFLDQEREPFSYEQKVRLFQYAQSLDEDVILEEIRRLIAKRRKEAEKGDRFAKKEWKDWKVILELYGRKSKTEENFDFHGPC